MLRMSCVDPGIWLPCGGCAVCASMLAVQERAHCQAGCSHRRALCRSAGCCAEEPGLLEGAESADKTVALRRGEPVADPLASGRTADAAPANRPYGSRNSVLQLTGLLICRSSRLTSNEPLHTLPIPAHGGSGGTGAGLLKGWQRSRASLFVRLPNLVQIRDAGRRSSLVCRSTCSARRRSLLPIKSCCGKPDAYLTQLSLISTSFSLRRRISARIRGPTPW